MSVKRALLLFLILWGDAGVSLATSPVQKILLITIDTLRADHLGCYGYTKGTSPNIDALAKQSLVFTSAFTPVPLTLPAHATILSGLYPAHHGFRDNAFFQTAEVPLISQALQKRGFATAAFVSGAPLSSTFGLNRGFHVYDDNFTGEERVAADTTERATLWIRKQSGSYFVWVHYFDPHAEYNPPAGFESFANPYDGEIAYVDSQVAELIDIVGKDAIVLLTADHGESLGEHGENTHGIFLYNATLRVPLIVRIPNTKPAIRNNPVTLCDLAPTIASLAALEFTPSDGISLIQNAPDRMLFAESQYAARNFGYAPLFASIRDRRKFILAPHPEFYDLNQDPGEINNVVNQSKTDAWKRAVQNYAQNQKSALTNPLPEEDAEKLRALGYVSGTMAAGNVDPKQRVHEIERFNEAMRFLSRGDYAQAESAFRIITKEDSKNALGYRFLGDSLSAQRKYAEAAQAYLASVTLRPDAEAGIRLAKSQFQAGDPAVAKKTLEVSAHKFPAYEPAIFELASLYSAEQNFDAALAVLKGDSAETHNQRGIIYLATKRFAEAEKEFRSALAIQEKPEYWNNAGLALQRLNRIAEAEDAYGKALNLSPDYQECEVNLAFLLVQQQKWDPALSHLVHLTDANPKMWNARLARGYALENLGRKEEALQQYESLQKDVPPDWPQLAQLQSRIEKIKN